MVCDGDVMGDVTCHIKSLQINQTESKLHLMYGSLIRWYRRKCVADAKVMQQLLIDKQDYKEMVQDLQNSHCCCLEDVETKETDDLICLQQQSQHLLGIKEAFDQINLHYNRYMNIEDRRVAKLLEDHSKLDETFLVSFHKFCISKYQEYLSLGNHYHACPEEDFES